jgi:multidrug efflux pump subunit AcrA (membrane-fusion protein)
VVVLSLGAALTLALMVLGPRFAVRSHGVGVLEPAERAEVRAAWAGFVAPDLEMPREGDQVQPGQLLVRLENPDLVMEQRDVALEEESLRRQREALEARGDPAAASAWRVRERAAAEKSAILAGRVGALEIRAPIAGVVLTPRLEDRAGSFLKPGDAWCLVGTLQHLRVRMIVTDRDLGLIHEGGEAEIKGYHFPDRVFHGRVTRLPAGRRPARPDPDATHPALPVTATMTAPGGEPAGAGSLDVDVDVDNAEGLLRPGMTVSVRIYGERLTPAGHVAMWARRLFKGKIWW